MKQTLFASLVPAFLLAVPVQSQQALSYKLGISAGSTAPTEDTRHYNHSGFNVGAFLDVLKPNTPVGVRLEAQHNRLNAKGSFRTSQITSGTVSLELNSDYHGHTPSPFLAFGAGAYHIKTEFQPVYYSSPDACAAPGCAPLSVQPYGSVTKLGFNGGAGLRMPLRGFDTFVEARYHWISTRGAKDLRDAITFVPISFGIRF